MINHLLWVALLSGFHDFFPVQQECNKRYNTASDPYDSYFSDCFFTSIVANEGPGSTIYYSSAILRIVIERCVFYECKNSGAYDSGNIFFVSTSGEIVLSKICGSSCYTTNNARTGQFCHITSGPVQKRVEFLLCSITQCSPNSTVGGYCSLYVGAGSQYYDKLNLSNNGAVRVSGLNSFNPFTYLMQYCNIVSNYASTYRVMYLQTGINTKISNFTNFVNNSSPHVSYAVIDASQTFNFHSCVFTNNGWILFSGQITLSKCFITHLEQNITYGAGVYFYPEGICNNNPFCMIQTYEIIHFSSAMCDAATPAPTIIPTSPIFGEEVTPCATIPNPPTPHRTYPPSPSQCIYDPSQQNSIQLAILLYSMILSLFTILSITNID